MKSILFAERVNMWQRIGSRCGPGHSRPVPDKVPPSGKWDDDRGQFISNTLEIIWRRGRWEKRYDKVLRTEVVDFFFHGAGYSDYECTRMVHTEKEFGGLE